MAVENEDKGGAGADKGGADTDSRSLVGGAGMEGGDKKADEDQPSAEKVAADKAAAEKATVEQRSALEKEIAKELEGKTDAEKKTILDAKMAEKAEAARKVATEKGKTGAPEKYTDFKLPEGVKVDESGIKKFSDIARKHNLSQDAAQEFVSLQAEIVQEAAKASVAEFDAWRSAQRAETQKALGADSAKELTFAGKGIERFGSPELRDLLDKTGLGENVHFARYAIAVGKQLAEDDIPGGGKSGKGGKAGAESNAKTWFPNSNMRSQAEGSKK